METKLKIIEELEKNQKGVHLRELSRLVRTGLPNINRFVGILEKEKVIKKQREANLLKIFLRGFSCVNTHLKNSYSTLSLFRSPRLRGLCLLFHKLFLITE